MIKKLNKVSKALLSGALSLTFISANFSFANDFSKKVVNVSAQKINFTILNGNSVPREIEYAVNNYNSKEGAFYINKGGYMYIAVFAGQKPTSGYRLSVSTAESVNNRTTGAVMDIGIKETAPAKNSITTQIITYPAIFIKFKTNIAINIKNKPTINVAINNGKAFKATEIINPDYNSRNNISKNIGIEKGLEAQDFSVIANGEIPSALARNSNPRGYSYLIKDGYTYFAVYAGKKSSGGYSIDVMNVQTNKDKTIVTVKESNPPSNSFNIQALTYPYSVVRFKTVNTNFIVKTADGNDFKSDGVDK